MTVKKRNHILNDWRKQKVEQNIWKLLRKKEAWLKISVGKEKGVKKKNEFIQKDKNRTVLLICDWRLP